MTEGGAAVPRGDKPGNGPGSFLYDPVLSRFVGTPQRPRTFFNAHIICRGEALKAAVDLPGGTPHAERSPARYRTVRPELRAFRVGEEPAEAEITQRTPFAPATVANEGDLTGVAIRARWRAVLGTGELAEAGPYVVQVYATSSRQRGVLGEQVVHVLEPPDYDALWQRLFGESWDEPVWWDAMDEAQNSLRSIRRAR